MYSYCAARQEQLEKLVMTFEYTRGLKVIERITKKENVFVAYKMRSNVTVPIMIRYNEFKTKKSKS